jgi:MFS transporter, DHA2 family, multidrug resistance protein
MPQPDRATPREWAGLAVLALPTLLLAMDATVLYLAVPHLVADLRPSANQTLWIVDAYGFMIAGFLVTMGTLGDRIGRRRLLFLGAAAFGVASAVAAYATTPEVLIAARAALGVAGATLMPSTLALISNMFRDPRQRATAIGVWATCMSAGFALGPVLGGLLLEVFWWGSVFLLGAPVMVLLLVTAPLLPEYRDPAAGRLDLTSVGLSLAAILPVVYGVKELAAHGPTMVSGGALVVGAGFATGFVRRQRRLPDPLLDLRMFGNPAFRVALLVLLVGLAAVGGIYLFVTQYLQLVAGMSPLVAGLWLLPATAASIVVSMLTPAVASRIRPGGLVGFALAVSAAGYAVLTLAGGAGGLPVLVAGFVLVYAGNAPIMVLGTDLVVSTAPREKAGSAAAMSETSMEFGVALGVAVLGVVGSAVYRAGVAGSGLGVEAGDSLATATATAAGLPAAPADALLAAARSAFTSGLTTVAGVCAVGVAALAVFAVALLRGAGGDETVAEPVLNGCRQTGDPAGVRPGWHSADDADPAG